MLKYIYGNNTYNHYWGYRAHNCGEDVPSEAGRKER